MSVTKLLAKIDGISLFTGNIIPSKKLLEVEGIIKTALLNDDILEIIYESDILKLYKINESLREIDLRVSYYFNNKKIY
ncbi:hypothetical protein [Lactococcus lactis]|uniref:hypothetical protein n=1 Tax=Lactococcus lactis TaxID=1358 RepID=UPI0015C34EAA|nr:hypothetical protein [Lactococcus lactis]MCT0076730.1 hypothetical protein [Lactococcus lactis subsp. lactis]QLF89366.1 hypothetical protein HPC60_00940 [Lactococcus lactis subsp. lactis]